MQNGKKFHNFIHTIANALKKHGVEELSTAIQGVSSNNSHREEIDYLITIIADGYGVSKRTLKNARAVGDLKQARSIAYCLLYYDLKLSCRHIALKIFPHKNHGTVWSAINSFNTLNDKVKQDRIFKEKYDMYREKLLEFIKKEQNA